MVKLESFCLYHYFSPLMTGSLIAIGLRIFRRAEVCCVRESSGRLSIGDRLIGYRKGKVQHRRKMRGGGKTKEQRLWDQWGDCICIPFYVSELRPHFMNSNIRYPISSDQDEIAIGTR